MILDVRRDTADYYMGFTKMHDICGYYFPTLGFEHLYYCTFPFGILDLGIMCRAPGSQAPETRGAALMRCDIPSPIVTQ